MRGKNEPFAGHKYKYINIPKAERAEFIKQLMLTPQKPFPPPYHFDTPFPLKG
jgi:hypothetical protein